MKRLLPKTELQEKLNALLLKYTPQHSQWDHIANNRLIQEALDYLLGADFKPDEDHQLQGYVLLAHLSGSHLYLAMDKEEIALINVNKERHDYNLNDQTQLFNLQGWRQIEFLPIFIRFQLMKYFKNSTKSINQKINDVDFNAIQQVLAEELWITANAFRLVHGHSLSFDIGQDQIMPDKLNGFINDFLDDLKLLAELASKKSEHVEILFPCGITAGHAIYLSLFCYNNNCDIRIFNTGLGSNIHLSASSDSNQIFPYYVGSVCLMDAEAAQQLSDYLQCVCTHSYKSLTKSVRENNKIITLITNDIYKRKAKFKFYVDPTSCQEPLLGYPKQAKQNTCVTYSFFAWLYCRDGKLSSLKNEIQIKDETESSKNSVYNKIVYDLNKYAVTLKENTVAVTGSSYSNYLLERMLWIKKVSPTPEENVIFKLKLNVKNYILEDREQELYTPLDSKHSDSPTEQAFPLYDEIIKFVQDKEKQSLSILGDAGTGKTQFAEHITSRLILEEIDTITLYIQLANPLIIKPMETLIKENLIKVYDLSDQEADNIIQLGKTDQAFCFILDGVDELLIKNGDYLEFARTNGLFTLFKKVHCIFLSRLKVSGISDAALQQVFLPIDTHQKPQPTYQARSLYLQPFSSEAKNIYIGLYIQKRQSFKLEKMPASQWIERYRERINKLPFLEQITGKPISLMMTMSELDHLELYYKIKRKSDVTPELVARNLREMYIFNLFVRTRDEKPKLEGAESVDEIECYLGYSIQLAKAMIKERDQSVVYYTNNSFSDFLSVNNNQPLNKKIYDKFFCEDYDGTIFKNEKQYRDFRIGFQGCSELLTIRPLRNGYEYAFYHNIFMSHFDAIKSKAMLEGSTENILEFIKGQIQREKRLTNLVIHPAYSVKEKQVPLFSCSWRNKGKISDKIAAHLFSFFDSKILYCVTPGVNKAWGQFTQEYLVMSSDNLSKYPQTELNEIKTQPEKLPDKNRLLK